jgi:hypothetical protein
LGKTVNVIIIVAIVIFIALLISKAALGVGQPTQSYSKIFLTPYYTNPLTKNILYNFTLSFTTPDGLSKVNMAVINFNVYVTSSPQDFTLKVNNQSCNNPVYQATSSGFGQISFDCTNIINHTGTYNLSIISIKDAGSAVGWLETSYINNPRGTSSIFGTEYIEGDDGTIFLVLRNADGFSVNNATCTLDIYYPSIANQSHPEWINDGLMNYKEEGIYYYDFTVPLRTGVYMINAQCTYITTDLYYYPLTSNKAPIRNITAGTYAGDPFVLDDYSEWLYQQCDSTGGSPKTCESWYEWNLSSTSSNISEMFVQYLGENNGANLMNTFYFNWSNGAWVMLPNTLTFKSTASGGVPSGVDEYLSNKIPVNNQSISNNGNRVRIKINTTSGSTFKQWDNYLVIRTTERSSFAQDVKGSGEIHVTSQPTGTNRYFKVTTCNQFLDGRCGTFTNDAEFNLLEGEIEEYINISATSTKMNNQISFETPFSVDCTALYWIKEYNGTGWADFSNYELYSNPTQENCIVTMSKNIVSGTNYQFWIKMDNFMKWEVDWSKSSLDKIRESTIDICKWRNFTYTVPVTETTIFPNDTITLYCLNLYDDFYYADTYYNDSQAVNNAGEYASYLHELSFYRKETYEKFQYLDVSTRKNFTGIVSIGGTEYQSGEQGKVVVRLIKGNGDIETGATCNVTIYYPNQTIMVNAAAMTEFVNGTHSYFFTVPMNLGVYIYQTDCLKSAVKYKGMDTFHVSPWANSAGTITNFSAQFQYLKDTNDEQTYLVTDRAFSTQQQIIPKQISQPILEETTKNGNFNIGNALIISGIVLLFIITVALIIKLREKKDDKINLSRDIGDIDVDVDSDSK